MSRARPCRAPAGLLLILVALELPLLSAIAVQLLADSVTSFVKARF